jgi:hypothetical protein
LQISTTIRSADWIKASYDNQKSSQNLVNYGSVTGPELLPVPCNSHPRLAKPLITT